MKVEDSVVLGLNRPSISSKLSATVDWMLVKRSSSMNTRPVMSTMRDIMVLIEKN